eukprot:TRINITY_DN6525_c0_g1_i2.p1 TRINITY_DN6525_c0_g1~~TRINITY_DN6525_c0_g1_i2.p1  ORF type:complete len:1306 (-),score=339.04 TRINITY_DN6525_c0_g1_i2:71-3550(-)
MAASASPLVQEAVLRVSALAEAGTSVVVRGAFVASVETALEQLPDDGLPLLVEGSVVPCGRRLAAHQQYLAVMRVVHLLARRAKASGQTSALQLVPLLKALCAEVQQGLGPDAVPDLELLNESELRYCAATDWLLWRKELRALRRRQLPAADFGAGVRCLLRAVAMHVESLLQVPPPCMFQLVALGASAADELDARCSTGMQFALLVAERRHRTHPYFSALLRLFKLLLDLLGERPPGGLRISAADLVAIAVDSPEALIERLGTDRWRYELLRPAAVHASRGGDVLLREYRGLLRVRLAAISATPAADEQTSTSTAWLSANATLGQVLGAQYLAEHLLAWDPENCTVNGNFDILQCLLEPLSLVVSDLALFSGALDDTAVPSLLAAMAASGFVSDELQRDISRVHATLQRLHRQQQQQGGDPAGEAAAATEEAQRLAKTLLVPLAHMLQSRVIAPGGVRARLPLRLWRECIAAFEESCGDGSVGAAHVADLVAALAAERADTDEYRRHFVTLARQGSRALQEAMLRAVSEVESPDDRRHAICSSLACFPDAGGSRVATDRETRDFARALSCLIAASRSEESPAWLHVITPGTADEVLQGSLHRAAFRDLCVCSADDAGIGSTWRLKGHDASSGVSHLVLPVCVPSRSGGNLFFFFKFFPENPGFEVMAQRLQALLVGRGASRSVLVRLSPTASGGVGSAMPALVSLAVAGENAERLLQRSPDDALLLDPAWFTRLLLCTVLMMPEDAKPSAFVVTECGSDGAALVCVDCARTFLPPTAPAARFPMGSAEEIMSRSLVYCLDQMDSVPADEAVTEWLHLQPAAVLRAWLDDVATVNAAWELLFSADEARWLAQRRRCLVRVRLPPTLVVRLYQEIDTLQRIMKKCPQPLTHWHLLRQKSEALADFYSDLHARFRSPKTRWDEVARRFYYHQQSRTTDAQLLSAAFGVGRTDAVTLLARRTSDAPAVAPLDALSRCCAARDGLVHTARALESGDEAAIAGAWAGVAAAASVVLAARLVCLVDFAKLPAKWQSAVLDLLDRLASPECAAGELVLRGADQALDGKRLSRLLDRHRGHLQVLHLVDCRRLEELIVPGRLPLLSELKLLGCAALRRVVPAKGLRTLGAALLPRLCSVEVVGCPRLASTECSPAIVRRHVEARAPQ